MDADVDQLLTDGERYAKNARDALDREVKDEDELYIWQNQVEVLDTYLADTEALAPDHPELEEQRQELRGLKEDLEDAIIAWSAEQAGEEIPEEPPDEIIAEEFVRVAPDFLEEVDAALDEEITDIDQVERWEAPRDMVNSFLADSEPYEDHHEDLPEVREQLKERKRFLEMRIDELVSSWREEDKAES